jgi:hypothetical protein
LLKETEEYSSNKSSPVSLTDVSSSSRLGQSDGQFLPSVELESESAIFHSFLHSNLHSFHGNIVGIKQ